MILTDIAFYIFAALIVSSAAIMVFSKNVIYSAFGLLFSFFGVGCVYVLLAADLLAVVQILVYVGGILVLLLFGVMLSQKITSVDLRTESVHLIPAIVVVGGILFILIRVALETPWKTNMNESFEPTSAKIGTLLMTDYLIPFEISSVLLLAALIGAAFIARKES